MFVAGAWSKEQFHGLRLEGSHCDLVRKHLEWVAVAALSEGIWNVPLRPCQEAFGMFRAWPKRQFRNVRKEQPGAGLGGMFLAGCWSCCGALKSFRLSGKVAAM